MVETLIVSMLKFCLKTQRNFGIKSNISWSEKGGKKRAFLQRKTSKKRLQDSQVS